MLRVLDPFRFVLIAVAGWMNQWEYQIIAYGQKTRSIHHGKQWYSTLMEFRTGRAVNLGGFVDCPPVQSETRIEAGTLRRGRQTQGSAPMYPPSPGATSSPHAPRFVSAGYRRR